MWILNVTVAENADEQNNTFSEKLKEAYAKQNIKMPTEDTNEKTSINTWLEWKKTWGITIMWDHGICEKNMKIIMYVCTHLKKKVYT